MGLKQMAARVFCQTCSGWVDKIDYSEPNGDALERHVTTCPVNLAKTMFGMHPDLIELKSIADEISGMYGEQYGKA